MKNVAITLMGIVILVLAGAVGKMQERIRHGAHGGPGVEQLKGYLELVEHYSQITQDPTKTSAAAVIYSKELFKGTSPDVAAIFFNDILAQTHDVAIQRQIRMELIDLYLHSPVPDKQRAMEQLKLLLVDAPATRPVGKSD